MNQTIDTSSTILQGDAELATWNRPRSIVELRQFIAAHDMALDVEEICL